MSTASPLMPARMQAVSVVSLRLMVTRQFKTLRDMSSFEEIKKEQLQVVRVLGTGEGFGDWSGF